MDIAGLQRKLVIMLTVVGVSTIACAAALFGGIAYDLPWLTAVGFVILVVGFGVQIWFIAAFRKAKA